MEKLIITAAICGAEVTKDQNPAVPYTVAEIVREAKAAHEAGAAIVHLHVREDNGTPTQSKKRFKECIDAHTLHGRRGGHDRGRKVATDGINAGDGDARLRYVQFWR